MSTQTLDTLSPPTRVLQLRGGLVEAVHPFSFVAFDRGQVVAVGGPPMSTTFRSAAKPFQLACALELLGDLPDDLPDDLLALGAASHSGQTEHVLGVASLLDRFGLDPACLYCGAHAPMHGPSADALVRSGASFSALHNNCSGKHAFMAAASRANDWPADYRPLSHPLQRHIFGAIEALCEERPATAIDGCGIPTFCLPLSGIARAWSQLATAMERRSTDERLHRIGWAMARHPHLTSGTGRLDARLAACARLPFVGKIGAAGIFCIARPPNLGVVVKVHTGSMEAVGPAVVAVLNHLEPGLLDVPEGFEPLLVLNVVMDVVGAYVAA